MLIAILIDKHKRASKRKNSCQIKQAVDLDHTMVMKTKGKKSGRGHSVILNNFCI